MLPPSVTDDPGGTVDAQDAAVWRSGDRDSSLPLSDVAVNAVLELDGVSEEDLVNDPVARRAIEEMLAGLDLIDDDVAVVGKRVFEVRVMNVADVVGKATGKGARVGVQFHINSSRCAEAGGARTEKEV